MAYKTFDPSGNPTYKDISRSDMEFVDMLLAKGVRDVVRTGHDWQIIEDVLRFLFSRFSQEMEEFKKTVVDIRKTRLNEKGYSRSGEIKYLAALPPRFVGLVRKIFPFQEFDKKFMYNMIRKVPLFKVGQK